MQFKISHLLIACTIAACLIGLFRAQPSAAVRFQISNLLVAWTDGQQVLSASVGIAAAVSSIPDAS